MTPINHQCKFGQQVSQIAVVFSLVCCSLTSLAGTLSTVAYTKSGEVMSDVIIYATPIGQAVSPKKPIEAQVIAQDHSQFTPFVSVVQLGTEVKFPNYDKIEHHVKSFSAAKEFEIKPYERTTPAPILFDKTGIVVVYCLLHEWMRAYILVVDTPYFGKSDATGTVTIANLPAGNYEVRAWHPDMGSIKPALMQKLVVDTHGDQRLTFNFDFNPKKRKAMGM